MNSQHSVEALKSECILVERVDVDLIEQLERQQQQQQPTIEESSSSHHDKHKTQPPNQSESHLCLRNSALWKSNKRRAKIVERLRAQPFARLSGSEKLLDMIKQQRQQLQHQHKQHIANKEDNDRHAMQTTLLRQQELVRLLDAENERLRTENDSLNGQLKASRQSCVELSARNDSLAQQLRVSQYHSARLLAAIRDMRRKQAIFDAKSY
jgi:hypothetical protein